MVSVGYGMVAKVLFAHHSLFLTSAERNPFTADQGVMAIGQNTDIIFQVTRIDDKIVFLLVERRKSNYVVPYRRILFVRQPQDVSRSLLPILTMSHGL